MPGPWNVKNLKQGLWFSALLVTAVALALLGAAAARQGQQHAAVFLSLLALMLAAFVTITLVPRLLVAVKLDFLNQLQFFRFTRRGAFFVLAVLVIGFSSLNTGNNLLILILATLMASLVASGVVSNLVLHGLRISLQTPDSIHAGQNAVFFLTLHNLKRYFPSFSVHLKSAETGDAPPRGTDFFSQEKQFPYVRSGGQLQVNLHCSFEKRGLYPVNGFELRTGFPFGFFTRGRKIDAAGSIVVYPTLKDLTALFARYPSLQGSEEQYVRGLGGGLYNIRDYRYGDSPRFVHWKCTAKLSRLMVKEFTAEREIPAEIVFSTYLPHRSVETLSRFEDAVSAVASLSKYYWGRSRPFSLATGEFEGRVSDRREDYEALMEYLARVEPSSGMLVGPELISESCILFAAGEPFRREGVTTIDYLTW